jgi:choline kinase
MKTNREHYDNCFHQIANGDSKLQDSITLLAFEETLKILCTEKGTQPIGYDISPQNYILQHSENDQDRKIYLVDFYPPRLVVMSEDKTTILLHECLVDYPETKEAAEGERKERLQECYYTSAGMLRQFTHWFVATRYAKNKKNNVDEIVEESKPLLKEMMDRLKNDSSLLKKFLEYVDGECFKQDLTRRLSTVRQLWKQSTTPSTLVVAAAGKGTRALEDLKKNKLVLEVGEKPLVWHVVDAICEDIMINKVLFVVVDYDVKNAIDSYAKKNDLSLNYAFVGEGTRRGVGYAFYEGMKKIEEDGSAVLTVGDSVVYNAAGLFSTDHPVKVGVCSKDVSAQNLGKERTTTGQDNKVWIGVYYFDGDARAKAVSEFDAAIKDNRPEAKNEKGEYRFSWLIKALKKKDVGFGLGDVGKVAELNLSENVSQIEDMVEHREASLGPQAMPR